MGHVALQRVIVRMLYDPAFVTSVYSDSAHALANCGLADEERTWLASSDERAWRVDPYRRSRSLTGLMEEFPVASALVVRRVGGAGALDAFFSSTRFHEGMQSGRYMATDYADHLLSFTDAAVRTAAQVEAGLARARRRISHGDAGPGWSLAPRVRLIECATGSLAAYQQALGALRLHPQGLVAAIIDEDVPLTWGPSTDTHEHLLLASNDEEQSHIEPLTAELFTILSRARDGATEAEMVATCIELGADEGTAREILHGFRESGELVVL